MDVAGHPGPASAPVHLGDEDVCTCAIQVLHPRGEQGGHAAFPLPLPLLAGIGVGGYGGRGADVGMHGCPLGQRSWGLGGLTRGRRTMGPTGRWSTASPPAPSPLPPPSPTSPPPPSSSSTPRTPRTPSSRPWGRSSQPWTCRGRYVCSALALV